MREVWIKYWQKLDSRGEVKEKKKTEVLNQNRPKYIQSAFFLSSYIYMLCNVVDIAGWALAHQWIQYKQ